MTTDHLLTLMHLSDPWGVLSVYVDIAPGEAASRAAASVETRKALRKLERDVQNDGPRERWAALKAKLEELEGTIEQLDDPRRTGRGRALFASLSTGELRTVSLQVPLVNRVVLEESAYVRPLVAALDRGRPAGLITVSRTGVRACESTLGTAEEVYARTFEIDTAEWRENRGPADPNPRRGRSSVTQRDVFQQRLDARIESTVAGIAEDMPALATRRAWDTVVVAGDPHLSSLLGEAIGAANVEVITVDRAVEALSALELSDALGPELAQARARGASRLVAEARNAASSGGAGAVGLQDTLAALAQGRVAHLLFDDGRDYDGRRTPDGRLFPPGVAATGVREDELVLEPRLAERMIEQALETGARVSPLAGEPAEALTALGGVAALLRW